VMFRGSQRLAAHRHGGAIWNRVRFDKGPDYFVNQTYTIAPAKLIEKKACQPKAVDCSSSLSAPANYFVPAL